MLMLKTYINKLKQHVV